MKSFFTLPYLLLLALLACPVGYSVVHGEQIVETAVGLALDSGPADRASLNAPSAAVLDASGNLYIADTNHHLVRKIVLSSGTISTVAGTGCRGDHGDGGPATAAGLDTPTGLALDPAGNLYIADSGNHRIRCVNASSSHISTIAGNGTPGNPKEDTRASSTNLRYPYGIAVDARGALFVADAGNHCIRKVDLATGILTTVAGNGFPGYTGDGGPAGTAGLRYPTAITVDSSGNLFISDSYNNRIRKVGTNGIISTYAGNGWIKSEADGIPAIKASIQFPRALTLDPAGNLYIADCYNQRIRVVSTDGIIQTVAGAGFSGDPGDNLQATAARLLSPQGVAVDTDGTLYIADTRSNRIRKVDSSGTITTIAGTPPPGIPGDGTPAFSATLESPYGIALDSFGSLYFADRDANTIMKVTPEGTVTTAAGLGAAGYSGDQGPANLAELFNPSAVAVDEIRNLYVADSGNHVIRMIDTAGTITTIAGNGVAAYAETDEGGPAIQAGLDTPTGLALDRAGGLYIADTQNHRVRRVDLATGTIHTVAGNGFAGYTQDGGSAVQASLHSPRGLAVDASGNLFIADTCNHRLRRVSLQGLISTVAGDGTSGFSGDGGEAVSARLDRPQGVWVTPSGELYIADTYNYRLRKVSRTGIIQTVAGNGSAGFSGDGGLAASAQFSTLRAVVLDSHGSLWVADSGNHRIRKIATGIPVGRSIRAVCPLGCEYSSIQAAIDAGKDGDVVSVGVGTYFENLNFKGKNLRVEAAKGPASTIIDGKAAGSVVRFIKGESAAAVLSGFTIQNGLAPFGGGIRVGASSPTIENCVITLNTASTSGGGLSIVQSASPTLINTQITNNQSAIAGGGIYCASTATTAVVSCQVSGNRSANGAGIYFTHGTPKVTGGSIDGNTAAESGGGIMAVGPSTPMLEGLTLRANSAAVDGGGFAASGKVSLKMTNCMVLANSAQNSGAGGFLSGGWAVILSSSFNNNLAATGGAIAMGSAQVRIQGSILWGNGSPEGSLSGQPTITYSDVEAQAGVPYAGKGNINADPLFSAPGDDLHLKQGSPCINTGANQGAPQFDIDGHPRPLPAAGKVDMGADEVSRSIPAASGQTVTTKQDTAIAITLSATDPNGDSLSFAIVRPPTQGVLSGTAPNVLYTPTVGFYGSDSFTFKAFNGTAYTKPGTVNLAVVRHNSPPMALSSSIAASEDQSVYGRLSASDPDGDALTYHIASNGLAGTATITDPSTGDFVYVPNLNADRPAYFTFYADDGIAVTNTAPLLVVVTPVNDPPTISFIKNQVTSKNTPTQPIAFTARDVEMLSWEVFLSAASSNTVLVPDANIVFGGIGTHRTATITPALDRTGVTVITLSVNDGDLTTTRSFNLTVK